MAESLLRHLLVASAGVALVIGAACVVRGLAGRDVVLRYRAMLALLCCAILVPAVQWVAPVLIPNRAMVATSPNAVRGAISEWLFLLNPSPRAPSTERRAAPSGNTEPLNAASAETARALRTPVDRRLHVVGLALAVYVAGIVASAAVLLARMIRTRRLLSSCRPVDDAATLSLWDSARRLVDHRRPVQLLQCDSVPAPACRGVWQGMVILPAARDLSLQSLRCALCHELVHLRRFDPTAAMLQRLFVLAFWFHPLVRVFDRLLARDRELSCDALVVRRLNNPRTYAHALLDYARRRPSLTPVTADLSEFGSVVTLKRRLEMIVHARNGCSPWRTGLVLAGLGLGLAAAFGTHAAFAVALAAVEEAPAETEPPRLKLELDRTAPTGLQRAVVDAPALPRDLPLMTRILTERAILGIDANLSGTIVEQETLLSTPGYYRLIERASPEEKSASATLETAKLTLNLPEGSALKAVIEGQQVEVSANNGTTDIKVRSGEARVIDAAGVTRLVIRPKGDAAALWLRASMANEEVTFAIHVEGPGNSDGRL